MNISIVRQAVLTFSIPKSNKRFRGALSHTTSTRKHITAVQYSRKAQTCLIDQIIRKGHVDELVQKPTQGFVTFKESVMMLTHTHTQSLCLLNKASANLKAENAVCYVRQAW
jgi:hypothetical protein